MNNNEIRKLIGFYKHELTRNILPFWINKSIDNANGGYFNCFDNTGEVLNSRDKYTWSQGRFVWLWSKLSSMECDTFTKKEGKQFLEYARLGCDFLLRNCLVGENDWRCVFVTDEFGTPKYLDGFDRLDTSIYADTFVILGLAKFSKVTGEEKVYIFAKKLYESVIDRVGRNDYLTVPDKVSKEYKIHGIPMILCNVTQELYNAAKIFDKGYCALLLTNLEGYVNDVLTNYVDGNNVLHEVILANNDFFNEPLGQYANPGHTLEDLWFMMDALDILENSSSIPQISAIAKKAFNIGWDKEYGGLFHMCSIDGGTPGYQSGEADNDSVVKRIIEDWDNKLWWVHSEALYTSLRLYDRTNDKEFLTWHEKVFEYTFSVFPNLNRETREWLQILNRYGKPQQKVVALPVKDPYHIIRNLVLLIELLYKMFDIRG